MLCISVIWARSKVWYDYIKKCVCVCTLLFLATTYSLDRHKSVACDLKESREASRKGNRIYHLMFVSTRWWLSSVTSVVKHFVELPMWSATRQCCMWSARIMIGRGRQSLLVLRSFCQNAILSSQSLPHYWRCFDALPVFPPKPLTWAQPGQLDKMVKLVK